jgi:hypothetical protein
MLSFQNTKVGAELEYFLVRKSSQHARHAYLELSVRKNSHQILSTTPQSCTLAIQIANYESIPQGSPLFKMKQRLAGNSVSNGSMILLEELDFEKQNLYSLHLAATVCKSHSKNEIELCIVTIIF